MIVFLDTEFSSLVLRPRLLSVAMVEGGGLCREFYGEVTDRMHFLSASRFALETVVPQLGKVADAACTYHELGLRLALFFTELESALAVGEVVHLAFGYDLDWELVDTAIHDAGAPGWDALRTRVHPVNVHALTGQGHAQRVAEAYLNAQTGCAISRHHALCDARALLRAYQAGRAGRPCDQDQRLRS